MTIRLLVNPAVDIRLISPEKWFVPFLFTRLIRDKRLVTRPCFRSCRCRAHGPPQFPPGADRPSAEPIQDQGLGVYRALRGYPLRAMAGFALLVEFARIHAS